KIETQNNQILKFNTNSSCPQCGQSPPKLDPRYFSHSSLGQCTKCLGEGSLSPGLPNDLFPCEVCQGARLTPDGPIVRVQGVTFSELHSMPIHCLVMFVNEQLAQAALGDKAKSKIYAEIHRVLYSISKLSIAHLALNRSAASLSPGDLQRLRLASMISNTLKGALYALDEPCQGLTQQEVYDLVEELKKLVTAGASVVAVEHHPNFLQSCECLISMGPGAGVHGGQIVTIEWQQQNSKNTDLKDKLFKVLEPHKKATLVHTSFF
ncbi:MAG: hypothetical protein K2X39_08445, partial [Silvanigrellaceae bacterium]|nr:hypothetical protein [Silvanigrellaceae bacterium]